VEVKRIIKNLPVVERTASSSYGGLPLESSTIDDTTCWATQNCAIGEWLQFDLGRIQHVAGVITQGRGGNYSQWIKTYKVAYSFDGATFQTYPKNRGNKIFKGNSNQSTCVEHGFENPIYARYNSFLPSNVGRLDEYACQCECTLRKMR